MDKRLKELIKREYNNNNFVYDENKDIYSNYASQLFNVPYDSCLEHKGDLPYPMGKKRRSVIKNYFVYLFINEYGNKTNE